MMNLLIVYLRNGKVAETDERCYLFFKTAMKRSEEREKSDTEKNDKILRPKKINLIFPRDSVLNRFPPLKKFQNTFDESSPPPGDLFLEHFPSI